MVVGQEIDIVCFFQRERKGKKIKIEKILRNDVSLSSQLYIASQVRESKTRQFKDGKVIRWCDHDTHERQKGNYDLSGLSSLPRYFILLSTLNFIIHDTCYAWYLLFPLLFVLQYFSYLLFLSIFSSLFTIYFPSFVSSSPLLPLCYIFVFFLSHSFHLFCFLSYVLLISFFSLVCLISVYFVLCPLVYLFSFTFSRLPFFFCPFLLCFCFR